MELVAADPGGVGRGFGREVVDLGVVLGALCAEGKVVEEVVPLVRERPEDQDPFSPVGAKDHEVPDSSTLFG